MLTGCLVGKHCKAVHIRSQSHGVVDGSPKLGQIPCHHVHKKNIYINYSFVHTVCC